MTRLAKMGGRARSVNGCGFCRCRRGYVGHDPRGPGSGVVFARRLWLQFMSVCLARPARSVSSAAGLALVMLAIAVIDWRSFIIPDWLNVAGDLSCDYACGGADPEAMLHGVAIAIVRGTLLALIFLAIRSGYARFRGGKGWD